MLIFTSGVSGELKVVECDLGGVAMAGVTMPQRLDLGPDDVCYASMPLSHSDAVLVGRSVAVARRKPMTQTAQVLRVELPGRRPPPRRDLR